MRLQNIYCLRLNVSFWDMRKGVIKSHFSKKFAEDARHRRLFTYFGLSDNRWYLGTSYC